MFKSTFQYYMVRYKGVIVGRKDNKICCECVGKVREKTSFLLIGI